ncbi:hypothetical protein PR048_022982 [Dryococelus australis]|uniref:DDE-1 domain-containing protein n=1 Tax=Dryococelus australis TaxID=614101 RepID=A0ABQ9GSV8_9NEOP|nr:hypothetical protein PR048_022982 [Dryococelus australis]
MMVQKVVGLLDNRCEGTKVELKMNALQAVHYIAAAWKKVTSMTIANCFAKCGVSCETPSSCVEEDNPEFDDEFKKLDKINFGFSVYASYDEEVAACGIQSVEALCDAKQTVKDSSGEES